MDESAAERLKKIETSVDRIERGMFGDEDLDQSGIITRQANHEGRIKTLEIWVFRVGATALGASAVLGLIYRLALDWFTRA